ncbi:CDP-glucose 4,6-dehydratase, partial [Neobacillus drentensis]
EAWNFGPSYDDVKSVEWIVTQLCAKWGHSAGYEKEDNIPFHEARDLKLDYSKTAAYLGWLPRWSLEKALDKIIEWVIAYREQQDMKAVCTQQITDYMNHR